MIAVSCAVPVSAFTLVYWLNDERKVRAFGSVTLESGLLLKSNTCAHAYDHGGAVISVSMLLPLA